MQKAGLILEGGASRGIFTAGVLDCLMEQKIYLPYVCGVSAGACNAVDYIAHQAGRTRKCMASKENEYSYVNLQSIVRQHSVFDMDMIFDKFPNEIYPFDFDAYFSSDIECDLVVTNAATGKPEYKDERSDRKRLMCVCRASSSLPLFSPMVSLDGEKYVDGGISDAIPIARALRRGCRKDVLVLTRNRGYRKKKPQTTKGLYTMTLRNYPELLRTELNHYKVYNEVLAAVEKWEDEGRIFVIRPEIPPVKRTEHNYDTLTAFYEHGYNVMQKNLEKMQEYLYA